MTVPAITTDPATGRYLELVMAFPLRPIRSDEDLGRAIAVVDSLIDRDGLDLDEQDYLDVLADLVEKYEATAHPMVAVPEAEMLRHLIEAKGVTQARLAAEVGIAGSTISAILTGKRGMSKRHVAVLARYFHVSPTVFIAT